MLSFKPTFSLSTFTFIKRLFSSSSLSLVTSILLKPRWTSEASSHSTTVDHFFLEALFSMPPRYCDVLVFPYLSGYSSSVGCSSLFFLLSHDMLAVLRLNLGTLSSSLYSLPTGSHPHPGFHSPLTQRCLTTNLYCYLSSLPLNSNFIFN